MGNTSSLNTPALPEEALGQQLSFLNALHYDIVTQIISYLTQQDCLTCMAVCRDWYHTIPQYSQGIWRELKLEEKDISVNHLRRQQCMGNHVKHIVIKYVQSEKKRGSLTTLLQRLVDWKCTKIEYLEFEDCLSKNRKTFFRLLKQVGSSLTRLKLIHHWCRLPITSIFEACPELTHLLYTDFSTEKFSFGPVDQQLTKFTPAIFMNITHLYLRIDMFIQEQLEEILKRCPELRCYIGVSYTSLPSVVIDLDSLLSWCPKISYLVNSVDSFSYNSNDFPETGDQKDLCYLNTVDLVGSDQMIQCLKKNQHTLKHLVCSKPRNNINWTPIFGSLSLPNLSLLKTVAIDCSNATLIAFINRCPFLETLDITCHLTETIDTSDFRLLNRMDHLRDLCLTTSKINSPLCVPTVLGRFPTLENLTISGFTLYCQRPFECSQQLKELRIIDDLEWMSDDIEALLWETVFMEILKQLACQTNLELLHIIDFTPLIGFQTLTTIARIPTIKNLNLGYDFKLENNELEEFFRLLINTRIETLELRNVSFLSFGACIALATLPLLKCFSADAVRISCGAWTEINKDGLQYLLCTSPSLNVVNFNLCTVVNGNNIMYKSQISTFIQEQAPKFNLINSYPGQEKVVNIGLDTGSSEWLGFMIIKRRD